MCGSWGQNSYLDLQAYKKQSTQQEMILRHQEQTIVYPSCHISIQYRGKDGWNVLIFFYFLSGLVMEKKLSHCTQFKKVNCIKLVWFTQKSRRRGKKCNLKNFTKILQQNFKDVYFLYYLTRLQYFPHTKSSLWIYIFQRHPNKVTDQIYHMFMQY